MTKHDHALASVADPDQAERRNAGGDRTLFELAGAGPRISSRPLARRTVLRGLGVSLALPMLESMALAGEQASPTSRRRLAYLYVPNGVAISEWRQSVAVPRSGGKKKDPLRKKAGPLLEVGEHRSLDWPTLLAPLSEYRDQSLILRGLTADKARANGDGAGDHARAAAAFLTGVQPLKTEGRVQLGISADRIAARAIGHETRLRGLSVGLEPGLQSGQCDSGYACAYSGHVSWESEAVPAHKETRPVVLFDRLFRGGDGHESRSSRERRRRERRSVLDFVREDAKKLRTRLGVADRDRLDEYETGLRELERQLAFESSAHVDSVSDDVRPDRSPRTFAEEARLMGEILGYAF
ncbi:MAG: DUF1552 domain-containing protein, partial [Planctomycetota bacterium]